MNLEEGSPECNCEGVLPTVRCATCPLAIWASSIVMLPPYGKHFLLADPCCVLPELRATIRISYPVDQRGTVRYRVTVPITAQLANEFCRRLFFRCTLCQHFLPEITCSFQRNSLVALPLTSTVFWDMRGLDG